MVHRKKILFTILIIASVLRFWGLDNGDALSDEVLYSFRAIGMLDFDEAADQTTPLEWFDPSIPSWTKFSFHDHPPLVFAVQHVFMRVFGETPFAFRLPSALLGIASVYLLYLIGSSLYGERVGLLAAMLMGVTVNHVVISRLGLQESYVIFFILLSAYFFLKAEKQKKYYILVGIATGFALLTKYTTVPLAPIYITYMFLFRRGDFSSRFIWVGTAFTLLIFSPVLYYNYKLYQAVGHFDFQLSYLAGQNPDVWSIQPGKEEFPTLASRARIFFPNILYFNSWLFLSFATISISAFLVSLKKNMEETLRTHAFILITFAWFLLLIVGIIGPSLRFLAMLTPFLALGISSMLAQFSELQPPIFNNKNRRLELRKYLNAHSFIICILIFEILYSINSQLIPYPKGPKLWAWSPVRYENYHHGYEELDAWIRKQTNGRMPALAFEPTYHFITEIHKQSLAADERTGKKPYPALFVYDKNIQSIAQLWILDRLQIYHAWPIITADTYITFLNEKGADYFEKAGFTEIYYIFPTQNVPWKKPQYLTDVGMKLEQALIKSGLMPYTVLENKRSEPVFRIYREES